MFCRDEVLSNGLPPGVSVAAVVKCRGVQTDLTN